MFRKERGVQTLSSLLQSHMGKLEAELQNRHHRLGSEDGLVVAGADAVVASAVQCSAAKADARS